MALYELEARKLVAKNLRTLMRLNNIKTQKELAEILEVGQAQLCHIMKGEQFPTVYPFLANIQNKFGYTIDEFLFTDIGGDSNEYELSVSCVGYEGVYQVYYMSERNKIQSGVLLIKKPNSVNHVAKAVLLSKLNLNYANVCWENTKRHENKGGYYGDVEYYMKSQSGSGMIYEGEVTWTNEHVFVNLCNTQNASKVLMTFYREYSMKTVYEGGIGTMSIVGEGRAKIPAARFIGISRKSLEIDEREIIPYLSFTDNSASLKIDSGAVREILERLGNRLYCTEQFSTQEQIRLASAEIEDFVIDELNKRIAKEISVTPDRHDIWREFIKENQMVKRAS